MPKSGMGVSVSDVAAATICANNSARLDGVTAVELYRNEPARLKAGHREREVGLQGLPLGSRLRRIVVDEDDRPVVL